MAEAIALRDAAELFDTSSAGLRPLGVVQKLTLETLEANGYSREGLYSKGILEDIWDEADLVINMSGFPRERAFARDEWGKVEDWQVDDPFGSEPVEYQRVFEDIRAKIESLKARLRAKNAV
jgi:protein-tyrosine-phosphatase